MLIYLADLTHTGLLVASNVFPLGIGLVGANILREIPGAQVELFKYPDDLDLALSERVPDVFGISNYSWNANLGHEYLRRIKQRWPHVVTIAGGPNYGATDDEQRTYWDQYGEGLDYYVYKEGELAVVELLQHIFAASQGGNIRDWILSGRHVRNCHSFVDDRINNEGGRPRIRNLDELPSPYTHGLMDKFFDGVLIPLVHTTRGCPFSCSFCTEGQAYWNKVAKRSTLIDDLDYIGPRIAPVRDLYLSDANVGMFTEDADKARAIAQTQAKYKWPDYIHCSGGKNHKERVLEFAEIVGGKMGVSASLQTTDVQVLKNIKRENINVEQLVDVARRGSKIDANTYAEIILGLPGDSLAAHIQSLRDAVNSGVSYLRMYQLIMLPETEMNTQETRDQYGIKTHWRIMPRCFGRYSFQGESFDCAEIEEIATSQSSLSFDEYLQAREWDLTVEITHNANLFRELFGLCQVAGIEWFELLARFHQGREGYLHDLYATFRRETILPLWETRAEATTFAAGHLDSYLDESLGVNELFNAKAVAFFNLQEQLHAGMYAVAKELMPQYGEYLDQAKDFSLQRKQRLLDVEQGRGEYDYDFIALLESDFTGDPERYRKPVAVDFIHDADQRDIIDQLVHQYGTSNTGLGRILLRAHVKKLFRQLVVDGVATDRGLETQYRRSTNLGD
jgi:radical SAM superfamily enzyme YgiQ (UPF0313 family)